MYVTEDHKLADVEYVESPNQDARPDASVTDMILMHAISLPPNKYGGSHVQELFTNTLDTSFDSSFDSLREVALSAHLFVARDGEMTQFVPFNRRAWHAGESSFRGRRHCNNFSIGIELEGSEDDTFECIQYVNLAAVTRALVSHYPHITHDRIVGHSEVAPGRKWDPGTGFCWAQLMNLLYASEVGTEYGK